MNAEGSKETRSAADLAEYLARYHVLAKRTQNPMYAWFALKLALDAQVSAAEPGEDPTDPTMPVSIPYWLARYLWQVADILNPLSSGIDFRKEPDLLTDFSKYRTLQEYMEDAELNAQIRAELLDLKKAMELVPQALGLTRAGWNAFESFAETTRLMQEFSFHRGAQAAGVSSAEAVRALTEALNISERQAFRRVQKGRKISEGE